MPVATCCGKRRAAALARFAGTCQNPVAVPRPPHAWSLSGSRAAARKEPILAKYLLKLYVTGKTPRAENAITNLRRICDEQLRGEYELEIIDVLEDPERAEHDKVLATPTLIKRLPPRCGG